MSNSHPFTLYFVRLSGKQGWMPGLVTIAPEEAAAFVAAFHPGAVEVRLVAQGTAPCVYDPGVSGDQYGELDHALARGWWYDIRRHFWLAPEETAAVPVEKPLPAIMTLETDGPSNGWWIWRFTFAPLVANDAAIWARLFGNGGRVGYDIDISDAPARDPLDNVNAFIASLREGRDARLVVDEEGSFTGLLAWHSDPERIHLRLMSVCRPHDEKYDFLVMKHGFLAALENARRAFLAQGGWEYPDG